MVFFFTEIKEKKLEPGKHDGKSISFCFILSIPRLPLKLSSNLMAGAGEQDGTKPTTMAVR